jgi:hypothetical protein
MARRSARVRIAVFDDEEAPAGILAGGLDIDLQVTKDTAALMEPVFPGLDDNAVLQFS